MDEEIKLTPMFEQYQRIKADYPDTLLFYRMGDFYELFFSDAEIASRELQIALTSRSKVPGHEVPMCGVPWHASRAYIAQLIDKGYVVAICEQTEDPKQAKGLVKRAVTQVITPGTILDLSNLDQTSHNYLACIQGEETGPFAFVWADISTAQWTGAEFHKEDDLWQWVLKMAPRELLVPQQLQLPNHTFFEHIHKVRLQSQIPPKRAEEILCKAQHVRDLDALGLAKKPLLAQACAQLLHYLEQTQHCVIDQLEPFVPLHLGRRMLIDDTSERNLELFVCQNGHKGKGTLRHVLAHTVTPMGARKLEEMLHHPWRDLAPILEIESYVAFLADHDRLRFDLRESLSAMHDIERVTQRIALNRSTPKDFVFLAHSLAVLPTIRSLLEQCAQESDLFEKLLNQFDSLDDVACELQRAIVPDPPQLISEGGLFQQGYNEKLDTLLDMVEHAEQKLEDLLLKERESTGLAKLKLGYNRVFGYYYEVSRNQSDNIPPHFVRRQSLANAERFTTEELKELESKL
ncbi:MAG: DNA mismatch repair protein MutS, partial [Desulfovibrio sp.]|nr:DNA mismatch repair protein MutS [Desulfovibrio sp.]